MSNKSPIIGIDLGTTCCCVGYLGSNQIVEIIENKDGHKTTPSYVAFTEKGETIIGNAAKKRVFKTPENVVYDAKRLMGQKFGSTFLQQIKQYNWVFKLTSDANATPLIEITHKTRKTEKYKPQEISAILLKYMKTIAEERLDTEVKDAVITVPAHFNYHQRTATKEAGELAGLNVLKIINEPTAAALAYVHKNEIKGKTTNIVVFDLGGGTFDVSIVTAAKKCVTVKATAGNTTLGGRNFDRNLSEFLVDKIEKRYNKKMTKRELQRIRAKSEQLKIDLSSATEAQLDLDNLLDDVDVDFEITRSDFDEINSELFQICIDTVKDCLKDAEMSTTDIDKIVLVGGSTRIPKIQEMLVKFFEGKQLTKAINPDEAVAYGAAVQAAVLTKSDKTEADYEVNDVTSLSLGTVQLGGLMSVIIPRNCNIPISKTVTYSTVANNTRRTIIPIYEGERRLVQHNTRIGTTVLQLPPKPPGYSYYITFHVNASGILEVRGKTADGDYSSLAIKYEKPNNHTANDILRDAEINTAKDNQIGRVIEKWRKLREYCVKMETLCDYNKRKIIEEEKNSIRTICKKITIWLNDNEVRHGSAQEETAILDKNKEIENICEPIVNSYGYYVRDMRLAKFHELISQ